MAKDYAYISGIPRRISYDNLKAAVQRILEGRNRQEQQTFIVFRSHYTPCATLFNRHQACEIKWVASQVQVEKDTNGMGEDFPIPLGQ